LVVISFLIHAEAIFTFNYNEYIIENSYKFRENYYFNKPNLNRTFIDKEYQVSYKTNKQGYRIGIEDDPEITVNNADWLFIGDSFTQGAQVEFEDLYTSKLYNNFPNKIIINAGISGLSIPDEYNYYINQGMNLSPKKVFLQICNFNDFMMVKEQSFGFSDYIMQYSNFVRFVLYDFKYANPAELPLGRWTEPFYPDEESNIDYNIFYKEFSKTKKQDIENLKKYLQKFKKAVEENGAELIILQIPTKEQVHFKFFNEVINEFKIDVDKLDMDAPNKIIADLCTQMGIRKIDLLNNFRNSEDDMYFEYDEHLNEHGHNLITKSIYDLLYTDSVVSPERLSKLNVTDRYPTFSKNDSNQLLFQSFRDGNMELFYSDSIMQNSQRLTWNNVDEIHPWMSPTEQKIIFTEGNQWSNETNVVLMNLDGSERKLITSDKNIFGAIPSFSSDGNKITYAEWKKYDDGSLSNSYIVVLDLILNRKKNITSNKIESWRPIFSHDDNKLLYISNEDKKQFDIYSYNLITEATYNLTNTPYDEWDPCISRDGKVIVYSGYKNNNWDLFSYEFKTKKNTQITNTLGNEWDPTFSPNNKNLYFAGEFGLNNGIFKLKLN